ncbi:MAG: SLC13 family permease [Gloeomargarita sp. DG02_3_bins_56]
MATWQTAVTAITFLTVLVLIMTEWVHLTVAALLGAMVLVFCHVLSLGEAISYIGRSYSTLALFFGVMVLVRAFEPTKIFEYWATQMVFFAQGQGKRLLLGVAGLTTVFTAFLPNATTVVLLAPLLPTLAEEIGVDFVPLLILMVISANSGSLLTLVGDPVTFIIGDAIGMSFTDYLWRLSLSGGVAMGTVLVMLPWLFPKTWRKQLTNLAQLPHPQVNHPFMLAAGGVVVLFVLVFFVVGEYLPVPMTPAAVALMGAALALLLAHNSKIDTVHNILQDVDWSTLIFFMSFFVLVGGLEKVGIIQRLSELMPQFLGNNIACNSLFILVMTGILSSLVPNIPLAVGMLALLKSYLVQEGWVSAAILQPGFRGDLPAEVLPLFFAMMLGCTLGGNGTLVGASANIVAAGVAEQHGRRISFRGFLLYGLPVMVAQLFTAGVFLLVRFFLLPV